MVFRPQKAAYCAALRRNGIPPYKFCTVTKEFSVAPTELLHSGRVVSDDSPTRQRSRWLWVRSLRRNRPAMISFFFLALLLVTALLAPAAAPYDPNAQDYGFLEAPSGAHWMGTDDLGRDLFSRIVFGSRISLFVGISTVLLSMSVGVVLGLLAGYYGGWIDTIIMRYIDLQWASPTSSSPSIWWPSLEPASPT